MSNNAIAIVLNVWGWLFLISTSAWATPPLPQISVTEHVALAKYIFVGREVDQRFVVLEGNRYRDVRPSEIQPYPYYALIEVEVIEAIKPNDWKSPRKVYCLLLIPPTGAYRSRNEALIYTVVPNNKGLPDDVFEPSYNLAMELKYLDSIRQAIKLGEH